MPISSSQPLRRRIATFFVTVAAAGAAAGVAAGLREGQDRRTWSEFGGGPDNARYLTLDQIDKSNVGRLAVAWTYPTRDAFSYVFNPLIVGDVMYVLARNSAL